MTSLAEFEREAKRDRTISMRQHADRFHPVHQAIGDAVSNIKVMPAKYTSFPAGPRVYGVTSGRSLRLVRELVLDADYLGSFGELLVPEPIWRALTRLNVWIEPALVAEWIRILKDYVIVETTDSADSTDFEKVMGMSVRIFWSQNFRALIIVTYCICVICVICG